MPEFLLNCIHSHCPDKPNAVDIYKSYLYPARQGKWANAMHCNGSLLNVQNLLVKYTHRVGNFDQSPQSSMYVSLWNMLPNHFDSSMRIPVQPLYDCTLYTHNHPNHPHRHCTPNSMTMQLRTLHSCYCSNHHKFPLFQPVWHIDRHIGFEFYYCIPMKQLYAPTAEHHCKYLYVGHQRHETF